MAKKTTAKRVVVKVFLYGIQPQIWRRFSIDTGVTFAALHDAIQCAMGWENRSPHEFRHGKGKRLVDVIGPVGLQDQVIGEFQDELTLSLADYIGKKKTPLRMLYRYDFNSEWIHEVVFEKLIEGEGGPEMIEGERACPPEDIGGHFQFMQALHGEIEWLDRKYAPESFDPAKVDFTPKGPRKRR
jgi:hypothetical protein